MKNLVRVLIFSTFGGCLSIYAVDMKIGDPIKVCYRYVSAKNPFDPEYHKKPLTCKGQIKVEKAPYGAGLSGATVMRNFDSMKGVKSIRALSVKAGKKPDWSSSSIEIKNDKNQFYDKYITTNEKESLIMYFHLEK